ncbi:MAG: hypothetical protein LBC83_03780 [Oscillospiraceae bacterium]|jgi:hypothetical protein|nr:hypothetical protein [Oscillospiraceae bacterium]
MSDNVDAMLAQMQELLDNGKKIGRSRIIDGLAFQDLIESLHAAMPNVVERAKEVVAQRADILEKARLDAEARTTEAQQRADELQTHTNDRVNEVVQHAKERVVQARAQGEQIVAEAQIQAAKLVEEHTITIAAQERAAQMERQARSNAERIETEARQQAEHMLAQAQEYSRELQQRTENWGMQYTTGVRGVVEEIVNEAEDILASSLTDIRNTKKRLQASMAKSAKAPDLIEPMEPIFVE